MKKILELWKNCCLGKINIIYERYRFINCVQEANQSFDTYASALDALAATCNFGQLKEELIRNRIVCGLSENALHRKFLQMSHLSLDTCVDVCRAAEAAKTQVKAMFSHAYDDTKSAEINAVCKQNRVRSKPLTKPMDMLTDCMYCGQSHEGLKARCPVFGKNYRKVYILAWKHKGYRQRK